MPVSLEQINLLLESFAPKTYAYEWDNSGFNINLNQKEITGVMICLDVTSEVIDEAAQHHCNLIISHHPLLFHSMKSIDALSYQGQCVNALIKNDISLYCAHTSMDTAPNGINRYLADALSLYNQEYLEETDVEQYVEIAVHVPERHARPVRAAMAAAGAGNIGNYSECTYNILGKGMFRPNAKANPFIGKSGEIETIDEIRISAVCPKSQLQKVLYAIHDVHPYEEPAISVLITSEPYDINAGLGIVGDIKKTETVSDIVSLIKEKLDMDLVRVAGDMDRKISRIAVCGGAAGDMASLAKAKGAQLYLTGEIKHNIYIEEQNMILVEAGHYDTEKCFCKLYAEGLQKLFDDVNYNVAIYVENLQRPYINY